MTKVLKGIGLLFAAALIVLIGELIYVWRAERLPDKEPFDLDRQGSAGEVMWLGDSTVAGVGASDAEHALPRVVADLEHDDSSLRVLAVSGATVTDVVRKQLPQVGGLKPTRIYIEVGANDVTHLTKAAEFEDSYNELLDGLPASASVVCVGIPDMGGAARFLPPLRQLAAARGRRLDGVIQKLAVKHGCDYVDLATPTGPKFRADPDKYLAADKFHPSDAGYQLWAEAIASHS